MRWLSSRRPLRFSSAPSNQVLSWQHFRPGGRYGDLPAAFRLAGILRDNNIERVVVMQSQDIHLASLASYFLPAAKIVFYQQMDSRHNKRDVWHRWIFSKLSLWITLTNSMRKNVLSCTRMAGAKVKVVPLGT